MIAFHKKNTLDKNFIKESNCKKMIIVFSTPASISQITLSLQPPNKLYHDCVFLNGKC